MPYVKAKDFSDLMREIKLVKVKQGYTAQLIVNLAEGMDPKEAYEDFAESCCYTDYHPEIIEHDAKK